MMTRKIRKRERFGFVVIMISIALTFSCHNQIESPISRIDRDWNADWLFLKDSTVLEIGDLPPTQKWTPVMLPHTPKIEPLVVNEQWRGTAWYKKEFEIGGNIRDKKIFITFEAAMQVADIWLNGDSIENHVGGYLPFTLDITDRVKEGINIVIVRLNNEENLEVPPGKPLETLDFNTYGGLYRNVKLIITDKLYITDPIVENNHGQGGILISYDSVSKEAATIRVRTHLRNAYSEDKKITLSYRIYNAKEELVSEVSSREKIIVSKNGLETTEVIRVKDPLLWHPEHPYLYRLVTTVSAEGQAIDEIETPIGLRDIKLKNDGFYINGEKFFIRGTNRHQEYPYLGYALSDEANYRDAVKIKSAGFDMVRLSHYPHSEAFLKACDELGLLVMNCIPGWQFMGDSLFRKNSLQNCRDMIRRDRNRASVVFWEVSLNETQMDTAFMNEACRILREELNEKALSAGWMDYSAYDLFIPARQHAQPPDYWNFYRDGQRPVFIAEYGDWEYYAQNAGFNQTAFHDLKAEERTSRQFRGDGERRMLQQALNYQESSNSNRKGISTVGHANWLMFDYNRGYADDIESSGISDIFRIPKYSYYFFQSQRPPEILDIRAIESGPMVYIASYWQPGSSSDIRVFSNCEEVALYLNDVLIQKKTADDDVLSTDLDYPPFTFNLDAFEPGKLEAIAFIRGEEVARHTVITPEEPAAIELKYDLSHIPLSKKGQDQIFIYARITDNKGTLCPVNGKMVHFELTGNGELIGSNPVATEAGIATVILQTHGGSQEIHIGATSENIRAQEISIQ